LVVSALCFSCDFGNGDDYAAGADKSFVGDEPLLSDDPVLADDGLADEEFGGSLTRGGKLTSWNCRWLWLVGMRYTDYSTCEQLICATDAEQATEIANANEPPPLSEFRGEWAFWGCAPTGNSCLWSGVLKTQYCHFSQEGAVPVDPNKKK